jgi:hypothetical protein
MARGHKGEGPLTLVCGQIRRNTSPDDASDAMRALVELFSDLKWHSSYRKYALERIDGELVFRQTESDAAVEAAIEAAFDSRPNAVVHRRIIKLP